MPWGILGLPIQERHIGGCNRGSGRPKSLVKYCVSTIFVLVLLALPPNLLLAVDVIASQSNQGVVELDYKKGWFIIVRFFNKSCGVAFRAMACVYGFRIMLKEITTAG